jgi:hypothetical protein
VRFVDEAASGAEQRSRTGTTGVGGVAHESGASTQEAPISEFCRSRQQGAVRLSGTPRDQGHSTTKGSRSSPSRDTRRPRISRRRRRPELTSSSASRVLPSISSSRCDACSASDRDRSGRRTPRSACDGRRARIVEGARASASSPHEPQSNQGSAADRRAALLAPRRSENRSPRLRRYLPETSLPRCWSFY